MGCAASSAARAELISILQKDGSAHTQKQLEWLRVTWELHASEFPTWDELERNVFSRAGCTGLWPPREVQLLREELEEREDGIELNDEQERIFCWKDVVEIFSDATKMLESDEKIAALETQWKIHPDNLPCSRSSSPKPAGVGLIRLGLDLSSASPTEKDDEEYNRLHAMYTKAFDAGREHGWPIYRCISVGARIEEQNKVNGLGWEEGAVAAYSIVLETIHTEQQLEQQKHRVLKQIINTANSQELLSQQIELLGAWAARTASEVRQEHDRLSARFTKAMLCGKKYDWPRLKCITAVQKIESEIDADPTAARGDLSQVALNCVMENIKAEKVLEQQRTWKLRRCIYIVSKKEMFNLGVEMIFSWATRASEAKAAAQ